jgi:hypothetical protein
MVTFPIEKCQGLLPHLASQGLPVVRELTKSFSTAGDDSLADSQAGVTRRQGIDVAQLKETSDKINMASRENSRRGAEKDKVSACMAASTARSDKVLAASSAQNFRWVGKAEQSLIPSVLWDLYQKP